jgi:hypothetical protein
LGYHFYLRRRTEFEDRDNLLEMQTMYLAPDNWVRFFKDRLMNELQIADGEGEVDITEEDLSELDRFMEGQEAAWKKEQEFQQMIQGGVTRTMSGAQVPLDWRQMNTPAQQWGPWQ